MNGNVKLEEYSLDAVGESGDVEVHQKTGGDSEETQVRHELSRVNRQKLVDRLEFDDKTVFDQEIDDVALCDLYSLVYEGMETRLR